MNKSRFLIILIIVNLILPIMAGLFQSKALAATVSISTMKSNLEQEIKKLKESNSTLKKYNIIVKEINLEWSNVVAGEAKHSISLVQKGDTVHDKNWICSTCLSQKKTYAGGNWLCASSSAVAYMVDPRNSLNASDMYQFMLLSYYKDSTEKKNNRDTKYVKYDKQVIINKLKGSLLDNGNLSKYVDTLIKSAEENDVNPYYIVAKLIQEGIANSKSVTFKIKDSATGKYYYNFFNFSANGKDTAEIIKNALEYAKKTSNNWDSIEKCMAGGIAQIGNSYISLGQNTLYFERFNVVVNGTINGETYEYYKHQYAQDVMYAQNNGTKLKSLLKDAGALDMPYTFVIPVYKSMPSTKAARPLSTSTSGTSTSTSTSTSTGNNSGATNAGNNENEVIIKDKMKIDNGVNTITTVPDKTIAEVFKSMSIKETVKDSKGNVVTDTSKKLGTGYKVGNYTIVVLGDVNGDAKIDIIDMALIKRHIGKSQILKNEFYKAGLLNKSTNITIIDMALIKRHLVNTQKIDI